MASPVNNGPVVPNPSDDPGITAGKAALDAAFKSALSAAMFDAIADGPYDEELYSSLTNLGGLAE